MKVWICSTCNGVGFKYVRVELSKLNTMVEKICCPECAGDSVRNIPDNDLIDIPLDRECGAV